VSTINIYGRTDCCSDRLSDYWVFVSDQPFLATDTPATLQNRAGTWNNHQTTYPNPSTAITVGAEGRYVRVQLSGTNYLSLAEVQVWSGWNQTFGYDAFGSLVSKTGSNSPPLSIGTNPANNQVVGQNYDANGNQTSYNGTSLSYDSENHLLSAVGLTEYLYDSQGKRIWKGTLSGGSMTAQEVYFYGVDGQKLGTYTLGLAYSGSTVYLTDSNTNLAVFFGGKRVAVNGTAFAQDRLGSQGKYYPYGENRNALANDQVKYATYTRDSATGLDYADQRYYSNQFGRFMSPDRYAASGGPSDPQSWNRYAYTRGDPVNRIDPSGLEDVAPADDGGCPADFCVTGYGSDGGGSGGDSWGDYCSLYPDDPVCQDPFGEEAAPPVQTFAGPRNITVTGYSRTGAKETQIADVLNTILNQVLTGGCASWLTGLDFSASDFISAIMGTGPGSYSFGYGVLNSNTTAAFVGNRNASGTPVAGLPPDSTITVNSNGAFFNSAYTVGALGSTQYLGGTLQAQVFILLHELAHEVGAAGFLPDAGNQANQNSNNALVQKNCGKQIAGVQ
jgi:RHS repeat-associated protein